MRKDFEPKPKTHIDIRIAIFTITAANRFTLERFLKSNNEIYRMLYNLEDFQFRWLPAVSRQEFVDLFWSQ